MKRRLLLLALPLILAALVFGVKWRADHPTPTKEDLEIIKVMAQADRVVVTQGLPYESKGRPCGIIPTSEFAPFYDYFHLLPLKSTRGSFNTGATGIIKIDFQFDNPRSDYIDSVEVQINSGSDFSFVRINHPLDDKMFDIHPATIKRWMKLLSEHKQVGAALERQAQLSSLWRDRPDYSP